MLAQLCRISQSFFGPFLVCRSRRLLLVLHLPSVSQHHVRTIDHITEKLGCERFSGDNLSGFLHLLFFWLFLFFFFRRRSQQFSAFGFLFVFPVFFPAMHSAVFCICFSSGFSCCFSLVLLTFFVFCGGFSFGDFEVCMSFFPESGPVIDNTSDGCLPDGFPHQFPCPNLIPSRFSSFCDPSYDQHLQTFRPFLQLASHT